MGQITISDINARLKSLKSVDRSSTVGSRSHYLEEAANIAIDSKRVPEVKRFIESCVKSRCDIPISMYLELFDVVVQYGTKSEIRNIGSYITENAIPKVRDAKLTNSLLKGRITRLQHKLASPISNMMDDFADNLKIDMPAPAVGSLPTSQPSDDNIEAATEAYQKMIDKNDLIAHCDRITENYNRISMRFNLDMLFIENTRVNGISDTVIELCNMIDTYAMDSAVKFNTVIETAFYGFETNWIEYDSKEVLETAIDYFMFKPDGIAACKSILESTMVYNTKGLDILQEEEPEEVSIEAAIARAFGENKNTQTNSDKDFNKIFNDFKKNELSKDSKPQNKLKSLVNKLYARDIDSIVNGTPDLLRWIRGFFILGTFAVPTVGPIVGIVSYIADKFISIHMDRQQYPDMIKAFDKEIRESKTKLNSTEDNEKKQKLQKYIKSLEDARNKINAAYDDLLSDEEQDKRYEEMEVSDLDDDFDDDFNFDEATFDQIEASIKDLHYIKEIYAPITTNQMYRLIQQVDEAHITDIARLAHTFPQVFHRGSIEDGIRNKLDDIKLGRITYASLIEKSSMTATLEHALAIITEEGTGYPDPKTIDEAAYELSILADASRSIAIFADTYENGSHLLEASFINTLNVASMKLRNAMQKLSDKDRQVSKNIDVSVSNLKKSMERALTNDNREAVIKGSVLPSFSKILKLCIINAGLVALHQPTIAIIGTIGYFALTKSFKAKERQMVIDEIEIELKMCQKYIDIAEQKNDMVALRQLLTTQRELERQRQRIKYHMQVKFGQKYYDAKAD